MICYAIAPSHICTLVAWTAVPELTQDHSTSHHITSHHITSRHMLAHIKSHNNTNQACLQNKNDSYNPNMCKLAPKHDISSKDTFLTIAASRSFFSFLLSCVSVWMLVLRDSISICADS